MNKAGVSFEEIKRDMLKDEEFKIEYEKLKPRYEAIEQIIYKPSKLAIKHKKSPFRS